jgi:topoisomerase-4 subunit A
MAHLIDYTINYYSNLLDKYGKGRERKTKIITFDAIAATEVVANNAKLYANKADGFVGYGLKKDEFISDCSDIDDIIVFRNDGYFLVTRITEKTFVGKDIIHVAVWKKNDERTKVELVVVLMGAIQYYLSRFPSKRHLPLSRKNAPFPWKKIHRACWPKHLPYWKK